MARVAVVGSANMDLVVRSARFPRAGETILGHGFETIPGGKGANQAVAARRLGAAVDLIGRVGADPFGRTLRRNLSREGIGTERLLPDPTQPTGVAVITVDDHGENTIIVVAGANARLTPADIAAAETLIEGADLLLMQLEIPLDAVEAAAQVAGVHGVPVILNAAPARPLPAALLARVNYLVINEVEAGELAGDPAGSPEQAARALLERGARAVVVTLGAAGALLIDRAGGCVAAPAFPVVAVDTTAAGDAVEGAFAVALASGLAPDQAVRWGNAAGTLAVTRAGAQPSLPTGEEVEAFLQQPPPANPP
jgi:ribokinase